MGMNVSEWFRAKWGQDSGAEYSFDRDRLDGIRNDVAISALVLDDDSGMSRIEPQDAELVEHSVDSRLLLLDRLCTSPIRQRGVTTTVSCWRGCELAE